MVDCEQCNTVTVNSQSQRAQFAPNVRKRKVLRMSREKGLPFNEAVPFAYPPTTYFHPKTSSPFLNPML